MDAILCQQVQRPFPVGNIGRSHLLHLAIAEKRVGKLLVLEGALAHPKADLDAEAQDELGKVKHELAEVPPRSDPLRHGLPQS